MSPDGTGGERLARRHRKEKKRMHLVSVHRFPPMAAASSAGLCWPLAPGAERDPRPRVTGLHTTVALQLVLVLVPPP